MQASRRTERVNVLLRQKLSEIIAQEMKDPRLAHIITIVHVGISRDLRNAKVFTSVLGSPEESNAAVETLNSASGFLRRELTTRVSLKTIPFLSFILDNSIEEGTYLLRKITEMGSNHSSKDASDDR